MALRRYEHPGKFEGGLIIDEYVHAASLDGGCETVGSDDGGESYTSVDGPLSDITPADEHGAPRLTEGELSFLASQAGAIIYEDSQGFVSVTYYADEESYLIAWNRLVDAYATEYDDDDDKA
jgi:hypothetical protein